MLSEDQLCFTAEQDYDKCIQINWLGHGELKQQNEKNLLVSALYLVFYLSVN